MKDILITLAGVAYGDGVTTDIDDVNLLTAGGMVAFKDDGTIINATVSPVIITGNTVKLAMMRTTEGIKFFPPISRVARSEFAYEKVPYHAGQAQVRTLGVAAATTSIYAFCPATIVAGDEFGVIFKNFNKNYEEITTRVSYIATGVDAGAKTATLATQIATGLFTAFNTKADANDWKVGAVIGSTGTTSVIITFTADDTDTVFDIVPFGETEFEGITHPLTVASIEPVGTATQILATERKMRAYSGLTEGDYNSKSLDNVGNQTVALENYIQYILTWYPNRSTKVYNSSNSDRIELQVVIPDGDALVVQFDNLLAAI